MRMISVDRLLQRNRYCIREQRRLVPYRAYFTGTMSRVEGEIVLSKVKHAFRTAHEMALRVKCLCTAKNRTK